MKKQYLLFVVIFIVIVILGGYLFSKNKLKDLTSPVPVDAGLSLSEIGQEQESKDRGFQQIKPIKIGDKQYKVAFLGSQDLKSNSVKAMELLKAEGINLVVQLGDFDSADNPTKWRSLFTETLGEQVSVLPIMGEKDIKKWSAYKPVVESFVLNTKDQFGDMECSGDIGRNYSCKNNMFHFVMVTPDSTATTTSTQVEYINSEFASSDSLWRICTVHNNQLEIYEACREAGAMIFTGHDNIYSRSYLLSSTRDVKVATTSDVLVMKPGVTFITVSGLGGRAVGTKTKSDTWLASTYSSKQSANAGALICTFGIGIKDLYAEIQKFDLGKAGCYFRDIKGFVPDAYYLESAFGR